MPPALYTYAARGSSVIFGSRSYKAVQAVVPPCPRDTFVEV